MHAPWEVSSNYLSELKWDIIFCHYGEEVVKNVVYKMWEEQDE